MTTGAHPPDRFAALTEALDGIRADPANASPWTLFYDCTAPRLRAQFAVLGVHDRDRADDLTQEVLVRFLRYSRWRRDWRTLPAAGDVMAYLRKVARHVFFDDQRSPAHVESVASAGIDPDAIPGMSEDLRQTLERMANHLSLGDRSLLRLLLRGRSVADIAEILGISYSAAGVRIHRLRRRMHGSAEA